MGVYTHTYELSYDYASELSYDHALGLSYNYTYTHAYAPDYDSCVCKTAFSTIAIPYSLSSVIRGPLILDGMTTWAPRYPFQRLCHQEPV
jgi:hypothetical protein